MGGFTQKVTMVDEYTGLIKQPGASTKTVNSVFQAMNKEIQVTFNAHNYPVKTLHGDAENVNHALRPLFGQIGTNVVNSLPGEHAHRAERSTLTVQNRARAVADGLPYYLTTELSCWQIN